MTFEVDIIKIFRSQLVKFRYCVLLLVILLIGAGSQLYAQKDTLRLVQKDASTVTPRYPDAKHLDDFLTDRDYQYKDDVQPPTNPFEKWIDWFWSKIRDNIFGKSYENFWQYVILAGIFALFVYMLHKAGILEYVFASRAISEDTDYLVGQENIHELNFERAMEDALSSGDYRLAIRLEYLRTLKVLSNKDLIGWKPNRTNYSYVQELEKYPYQADFVQITRYFEFAWYGDFQVGKSEYQEMQSLSGSFFTKLNQPAYV